MIRITAITALKPPFGKYSGFLMLCLVRTVEPFQCSFDVKSPLAIDKLTARLPLVYAQKITTPLTCTQKVFRPFHYDVSTKGPFAVTAVTNSQEPFNFKVVLSEPLLVTSTLRKPFKYALQAKGPFLLGGMKSKSPFKLKVRVENE